MKNIIIILLTAAILALTGCKCLQCDEPEFKPLPPKKLHHLLHVSEKHAYKSITKKDYIIKEDC